jgi:hypothetical protein
VQEARESPPVEVQFLLLAVEGYSSEVERVAAIFFEPLVNVSTYSPPNGPLPDPDACIAGVGVGSPVPKTYISESASEEG